MMREKKENREDTRTQRPTLTKSDKESPPHLVKLERMLLGRAKLTLKSIFSVHAMMWPLSTTLRWHVA